jgi:hypothetical protein
MSILNLPCSDLFEESDEDLPSYSLHKDQPRNNKAIIELPVQERDEDAQSFEAYI